MTSDTPSLLERSPLRFHELVLIVAIGAVFVLTGALDHPNHAYFTDFWGNAALVGRNASLLGLVALGAAVVIIAGGIDLSAGSMMTLSSTTFSLVMVLFAEGSDLKTVSALGIVCALGASLLMALLVGTLHAWLITSIKLPPFIATLATFVGLRSLARAMLNFVTLEWWGNSKAQISHNHEFVKFVAEWQIILPIAFLLLAVLTWVLLSYTVLGRHLYALGGNESAAKLSGIHTDNVKWFAYCFSAVMSALAGLFYMADIKTANPVNDGQLYELNAIAACVVGGCSLTGGIGTVPGIVLGALFLRLIMDSVEKLIDSGADVYQGIIVGVVVVAAVTMTQIRQIMSSGQRLFAGARGWASIPTLAIFAGLLVMMIVRAMDFFPGWTLAVGAVVTLVVFAALIAFKFWEQQAADAAHGQPHEPTV